MNIATGSTGITGTITATVAFPNWPSGYTLKYARANGTGGYTTLFTTTAGKTAYVLAITAVGTANSQVIIANDASTPIFDLGFPANGGQNINGGGQPLAIVASNTTLKFNAVATSTVSAIYIEA